MAYEATAELYRRQYDLAKKRAQSEYESRIGELATQYRQANRDLEGNLESRGILRSGEAMRGRVRLGAAEKGAQLSAEAARQSAMDTAGLSYMQQLAELQAKGYTGGEAATTPTAPGTGSGTPGTPSTQTPATQTPATQTPATQTPVEQPRVKPPKPGNPPPGYDYVWNEQKFAWELVALTSGGPAQPGMPAPPPGQGGPSEIGSGGRPIATPPPNFVPPGTAPGALVGGPDRKVPGGGAVVDGIYIPPGINFGPPVVTKPVIPIKGRY